MADTYFVGFFITELALCKILEKKFHFGMIIVSDQCWLARLRESLLRSRWLQRELVPFYYVDYVVLRRDSV